MISIRKGNSSDIEEICGVSISSPSDLIVISDGDKTIGLCGLLQLNKGVFAFAEIGPELRKRPLSIWRAACALKKVMKSLGKEVFAVADYQEINADRFLCRIGFFKTIGGLYKWTPYH